MNRSKPEPQAEDCKTLLLELYDLLEAYAPPWYSQKLQTRMLAILETSDTQKDS